jgi:hypothetical protein
MESKTDRLTILIDPRKKKLFEELCRSQDLNTSQVVRQLIREYITQHIPREKLPDWLKSRQMPR